MIASVCLPSDLFSGYLMSFQDDATGSDALNEKLSLS